MAIVIDVGRTWIDVQGKEHVRIGAAGGDFGGSYDDCGNQAFYCMTGGLEIVIPKAMPMKEWTYHGLYCKNVAKLGSDSYRIMCQSPNYRGRPTYTYSLSRGVISIESSPVASYNKFELRGDRGLFSPGNNP